MDQHKDYSDYRLINGCLYCGGLPHTREHVPSRVLLDKPYPENLPVVGACRECNAAYSRDEEYLACLIEAAKVGSTDPEKIERPKIRKIFHRTIKLRERIEAAKSISNGRVQFDIEANRVRNVLLKLAQGHAVFELSMVCRGEPAIIIWRPLCLMTEEELSNFDACDFVDMFGEVGTRSMQRMIVMQAIVEKSEGVESNRGCLINDWVEVQEGRYRYLTIDGANEVRVKIVLGEYLACEVVWSKD